MTKITKMFHLDCKECEMKIGMNKLEVEILDDSIRIYNQFGDEIVGWTSSEWIDENLTMTITNAINLAHTNPDELLNLIQFGKIR